MSFELDAILLGARLVTGIFFAISGYHKLFNRERHAMLLKTLRDDHIPMTTAMQWFVPVVELLAGLGLIVGLLTRLSAFGLFVICAVATCMDGTKRITEWHPLDKADWLDDLLYLPEVVYLVLLVGVLLDGPGAWSLDRLLW